MAYRYTYTEKWNDAWFSSLRPLEKLLFNYLCDNCDIAGFIEINLRRWSVDIGSDLRGIEGALKGLERGFIKAVTGDCLYVKNFLKHQKNFPLNEKNKAHQGILKRFELYSYKFDIQDINKFIEGGSKGLPSPTGNGNGNGNGNTGGCKGEKNYEQLLKERMADFKQSIEPFAAEFPKEMLNAFFRYWSEPTRTKTKMRFEMEKTWEIKRRLLTWQRRDEEKGKGKSYQERPTRLNYSIRNI